ncbi:MAG: XTP/dITP diphosphatase [Bacillota bacterium]|nr:XTP/dITP diphosphatase [Bacillota bacterium]
MKLIVASNNQHKISEIKNILEKLDMDVVSLKDAGIDIEVEEDGKTFEENAYKKAKEVFDIVEDAYVLADDTGLMVDAINGAPGVYSARFSGEGATYEKNNAKLLDLLKDTEDKDRGAKFVCVMVLIMRESRIVKVRGEIGGRILREPRGKNGFGYDPLFYVEELGKTFAEMSNEEKNSISHRGRALEKLREALK